MTYQPSQPTIDEEALMLPALTEQERDHLLGVLQRAENAQKHEEWRKVKLRTESSVNVSQMTISSSPGEKKAVNRCPGCDSKFICVVNPPKQCDLCGRSYCKLCMKILNGGKDHLCIYCFVDLKYQLMSGAWFILSRRKAGRVQKFAIEELRDALTHQKSAPRKTVVDGTSPGRRYKTLSPTSSPFSRRKHGKDINHNFGGSMPSIVINDEAASSPSSDHSSAATPKRILRRRFKELEVSKSTDFSDNDSLYFDSAASGASLSGTTTHSSLVTKHSTAHDSSLPGQEPSESATAVELSAPSDREEERDDVFIHFAMDFGDGDKAHLTIPRTLVSQESLVSLYSLVDVDFTLPADMASGEVQLSLEYERKKSQLRITIRQCKNLIPYNKAKRSSNPFVKIYLLPDKTKTAKRKTSYKRNTVHPVFNEEFKYHVESEALDTRSLWITVWHHITLGHNVFLGEVIINLANVHLDDPAPQWYKIEEKREIDMPSPHLIYKGDLSMAVKHVPLSDFVIVQGRQVENKGILHVWIKDAKNLIPSHSNGYSNPFAKVILLPDKSKKGKKKTEVIKKTLCPAWNTVLQFDYVDAKELPKRSLEITVWDKSRLRGNEFLGGVRLNLGKGEVDGEEAKWMNASGYEVTLWRAVMQRPDTWVEGCLALRAHMD